MIRKFLNVLPPSLRRQRLLVALCRLRLLDRIQMAEFDGEARAWIDLGDNDARAVFLSQSFWPELYPIASAFLRWGGDLFDVGANFGLVTFGTVPLVRGSGVAFHLFEANSRLIPLLLRSAGLWPQERFHVNHCCVTDRAGRSRLTLPDSCSGHAYIGDEGDWVPNLVLDDYIEERGIRRVGFLKMDIEGWEPFALRGARRALARGLVAAGFIEISAQALRRAQATPDDLLAALEGFGFDVYFCGLWDSPDPHALSWARYSVNEVSIRFAPARPLPVNFSQGDVLGVHASHPLAPTLREMLRPSPATR